MVVFGQISGLLFDIVSCLLGDHFKLSLRKYALSLDEIKRVFDIRENLFFAYAKTKTQISFAVTSKLISAFVFAT